MAEHLVSLLLRVYEVSPSETFMLAIRIFSSLLNLLISFCSCFGDSSISFYFLWLGIIECRKCWFDKEQICFIIGSNGLKVFCLDDSRDDTIGIRLGITNFARSKNKSIYFKHPTKLVQLVNFKNNYLLWKHCWQWASIIFFID